MSELYSRKLEGIRETEQRKKFDPNFSVEQNIEMGNISKEEAMAALDELRRKLDELTRK